MTPPRLAAWLVALAAPAPERREILADLAEEAATLAERTGAVVARRWYWRQTWRSIGPLVARRMARLVRAIAPRGGAGNEVRFAVRSLSASPMFSASVVALLAIGIGAHLVVYAVVDGLLLRPLPFGDRSSRLVTLHGTHPTQATDWDNSEISYPDLLDFRRQAVAFEAIDGVIGRNVSVSTGQDSDLVPAASITPGLFATLGIAPAVGRDFTNSDGAEIGFETVVILSHAMWQSFFGGDANIVGRPLSINGRPLTVIGVMPAGFSFPDRQRLWLPYRGDETSRRERRALIGIGLIREQSTPAQAASELQAIAARLSTQYPATNLDWGIHVLPMRDFFVSATTPATMLGAVTLLLLVVCANVSGLLIARGLARHRELSLRAALGAGRWRLVRLLLIEALGLAVAGGALGLALANWGVRALNAWIPEPPPYWAAAAIDLRVAIVAIGVTAVVAVIAGLLPALRLSRIDASGALLPGARPAIGTPGQRRVQRALVVAQVAVSFALLVGAGLLTRSAATLLQADGGFDPRPLLSLRFYITGDRYDPPPARGQLVNDVVARIAAIPGVRAVGATGSIPTDDGGTAIRVVPPGAEARPDRELGAQLVPAGPTFWQAIDRPLIEGRTFTEAEAADAAASVAIVNQRLAATLWGRDSAMGRTLTVADATGPIALRVIGVAPNLVYEEFGEETLQSQLNVYVPIARAGWRGQALLIRVEAPRDPASVTRAARDAIRAVDPALAVYDVMTMADRRAYNHWGDAFLGRTISAFAMAALLLAIIGAYAMAAHTAAQRTREIGLRLALGSTRVAITRQFVGAASQLAIAGLAIGAVLGVIAARTLESRGDLFRTSAWTPEVWIGPPIVLLSALIAASYLPARRASRIDPVITLRQE